MKKGIFLGLLVIAVLISCSSAMAYITDTTNMEEYWSLDNDNTTGTTCYGYTGTLNGTLTNGAVSGVTGKDDEAYYFDGDNDYLDMGNLNAIIDESNDWSISLWVYFNETGTNDAVFGYYTSSNPYTRIYRLANNSLLFESAVANGCTNFRGTTSDTFNGGSWYHIVATYDSDDNAQLWVNGVKKLDVATDNSCDSMDTQSFKFGSIDVGGYYLNGTEDEISLWSEELNDTYIGELYNSGTGDFYPFEQPTTTYPPVFSLNNPTNYELLSIENTTLNVTVTDRDNSTIQWVAFLNNSNDYVIYNESSVTNNTDVTFDWNDLSFSTTHEWYAQGYDGEYLENSSIYSFTTPLYEIDINWTSPENNTQYNTSSLDFLFNLSSNYSYISNCYLYQNGTINQTLNNVAVNSTDNTFTVNYSSSQEDTYLYYIRCDNGYVNDTTENRTIYIDLVDPEITTNFLNQSFWYKHNITGQFNISDGLLLYKLNISIDGEEINSISPIGTKTYSYNLSHNISDLSIGKHVLTVYASDGHTANELKSDYISKTGLFDDYLKYEFYGEMEFTTKNKFKAITDKWETYKKKDRYNQIYYPSFPSSTQTFIETSSEPIEIIHSPGSYNDYWIVTGDHWRDYVLKDEPGAKVSIKKINDYNVEVTITGIQNNPSRLEFQSIGDLNINIKNYTFYHLNMSETYSNPIFSGFSTPLYLNVDFGYIEDDEWNVIGGLTADADVIWNGTSYPSTQTLFNRSDARFSRSITVSYVNDTEDVEHFWVFNLSKPNFGFGYTSLTRNLTNTTNQSQLIFNVSVGECIDPINHTILNISYFDEVDGNTINLTNNYDLIFTDGTFNYEIEGIFPINGDTYDLFCTNINPDNVTYNWDLYGTFTLSKDDYVSRIIEYSLADPISVSNNPYTNLSLYLIETNASTTVKFNWLTNNYQLIDGIMRVYSCDENGIRSLVESNPIISGIGHANLQLLTQPYAYDLIIGDSVYTDANSWGACHIEYESEVTYYVDTDDVDVSNIIGLLGVPCYLTKSGNDVTMTWNNNSQDSSTINGCLVSRIKTIVGLINSSETCVNDSWTNSVTIPNDGNTYIVYGYLSQGGNEVICQNEIELNAVDSDGGTWGMTGLFASFLLVISMILFFAGNGEISLFAGGAGFIITWILGILNLSWLVVSAVVIFCIMIAVIGRYTRRPTQ